MGLIDLISTHVQNWSWPAWRPVARNIVLYVLRSTVLNDMEPMTVMKTCILATLKSTAHIIKCLHLQDWGAVLVVWNPMGMRFLCTPPGSPFPSLNVHNFLSFLLLFLHIELVESFSHREFGGAPGLGSFSMIT
jgi:hypothetical protein